MRILLVGFLVGMLLLSGCYRQGDVNRDGQVNALDVTALERIIVGVK